MTAAFDCDGLFAHARCGDWRSGKHQRVELFFLQNHLERRNKLIAQFQSLQVRDRRNFRAHLQSLSNVFVVFFRVRWIPAGVLVIVRGFGPGNLIARILGFRQQREEDFFQARATLLQSAESCLESAFHLRAQHIQKKFLGHA